MTLGSLFDGSGGFPLAGLMNGIAPRWVAEIEPYPCRVTAARFPWLPNHGDVTKINGAEIEPVDIITFGSPCQDLSVAGKQKGIHEGERSNLFFEAIRIIKEMRINDQMGGRTGVDIRPRFAVWENVPGAFSSNGGGDFRAVLQALCEIREGLGVSVPEPKKGKWLQSGCVVGDGFSIAWRVYDAQYWGVPQRRKRIYLIADFATERAGEILFECESMRGDSSPSRETREGTAADAEGSAGRSCFAWTYRGRDKGCNIEVQKDLAYCLREPSGGGSEPRVCYTIQGNTIDRSSLQNGNGISKDVSHTINTQDRHGVVYPKIARALTARHNSSPCVDRGQNVVALDCRNLFANEEISGTLQAKNEGGYSLNFINPIIINSSGGDKANTLDASYYKDAGERCFVEREYVAIGNNQESSRKHIVRRLTPLECCRLQGFPDWWEDGVEGSDSARYKMWGNGISLPCAADCLGRIANAAGR